MSLEQRHPNFELKAAQLLRERGGRISHGFCGCRDRAVLHHVEEHFETSQVEHRQSFHSYLMVLKFGM
jgi:hypothetical protein